MSTESTTDFLIVGAGIAGAMAANHLRAQGRNVQVIEAAAQPGGRLFTKRLSVTCGADLSFDIGAQFIRVMDEDHQALLDQAANDGAIALLPPMMKLRSGLWLDGDGAPRWRGRPTMASFVEWLLRDVPVSMSCPLRNLQFDGTVWCAETAAGTIKAKGVILALPPQAAASLWPPFMQQAGAAKLSACWSLSAAFDQKLNLQADTAAIEHDVLAWLARQPAFRDGERYGRDRIVVHAASDWSDAHRHASPDDVQQMMLAALADNVGHLPAIGFAETVLWPHAKVTKAVGQSHLNDPDAPIVAVGDWCLAGRAEAAMQSATAGANALLLLGL